ncbi:MAG: hypothetical protein WCP52_02160 [Bacteroidota bacterium]
MKIIPRWFNRKGMVIARLQLLYLFVFIINSLLSPVGWRVLHSILSLAIGYSIYNLSLKMFLFLIGYIIGLELISNSLVFPFDYFHPIGKEILKEIYELINSEKQKDG